MGDESLYVDEDPFALFIRAEEDIVAVNVLLKQTDVPEEYNYATICFHATQAVEKFMKGFIVSNDVKVKKSHNLDYIRRIAESIDNSFSNINNESLFLNDYTASIRYNTKSKIEKHEIKSVLKALNTIYHFSPISKMREEYKKKEDYRILPEFDFLRKEPEPQQAQQQSTSRKW